MGFFDDIEEGISDGFSRVMSWPIEFTARALDNALSNTGKIGRPIYDKIGAPVVDWTVGAVNKGVHTVENIGNKVANWGDNLFSTPMLILAGGAVLVILMSTMNKN